ncbi:MAG: DsbA family protein [Succiniclasticum sp.]|nr:DsbA family protein [Succiniclasticum sp.]
MTRKERFAGIVDWFEKNVPIAETELHYGNPYNFFNKHKVAQNHEDVVKIFEEIGISKEMFEAQYKSFPVMSAVSRYDQLSEDTGIEGVPTVVVNNKYKVLTEKINGTDEYMALINYLLSLDKDYYASGASSSKHE